MAHSPKKKAAVVADIASGESWDATTAKHKISKSTLKQWVDEADALRKGTQNRTRTELRTELKSEPLTIAEESAQSRRYQFNEALEGFLMAAIKLGLSMAVTCADPSFIRSEPTAANELAKTVFERADKLVRFVNE